eukprot:4582373-Lingulodinium_polyedra.AAC.1
MRPSAPWATGGWRTRRSSSKSWAAKAATTATNSSISRSACGPPPRCRNSSACRQRRPRAPRAP